jgi:hypothetical protein
VVCHLLRRLSFIPSAGTAADLVECKQTQAVAKFETLQLSAGEQKIQRD